MLVPAQRRPGEPGQSSLALQQEGSGFSQRAGPFGSAAFLASPQGMKKEEKRKKKKTRWRSQGCALCPRWEHFSLSCTTAVGFSKQKKERRGKQLPSGDLGGPRGRIQAPPLAPRPRRLWLDPCFERSVQLQQLEGRDANSRQHASKGLLFHIHVIQDRRWARNSVFSKAPWLRPPQPPTFRVPGGSLLITRTPILGGPRAARAP